MPPHRSRLRRCGRAESPPQSTSVRRAVSETRSSTPTPAAARNCEDESRDPGPLHARDRLRQRSAHVALREPPPAPPTQSMCAPAFASAVHLAVRVAPRSSPGKAAVVRHSYPPRSATFVQSSPVDPLCLSVPATRCTVAPALRERPRCARSNHADFAQQSNPNTIGNRNSENATQPIVLWLRLGEIRIRDNPALVAAATSARPLLTLVTVPGPDVRPARMPALPTDRALVDEAVRDFRREIGQRGNAIVVARRTYGDADAANVVRSVAGIVGARAVYVNSEEAAAAVTTVGLQAILCRGARAVLLEPPATVPRSPLAAHSLPSCISGTGCRGESQSLQRLNVLLGSPQAQLTSLAIESLMRNEVIAGCISRQRIRHMVAVARGYRTPALSTQLRQPVQPVVPPMLGAPALLSVAVYDVNGGDRRGIEWDEKAEQFRLKEWEHTERERRMNPKERGSEFVRRRKMFFSRAFFPDDVTPDYYSFTAWRFAQRCVSATVGVFGTQALLLALGVKAGRIGQAAAISWVLKDGFGRVGKMIWASGMGKDFDVDPKRWRFRSALLYAVGNGLEIVTQIFPASFLVVATLANSMKQVSMLTSSATRNAMYRSFGGRAQNIANITAKGEAQIVVADLIGMVCGIQLSKAIGTSKSNVLAAYTVLTIADIIGIYMELRQVVFRTLNAERSSIVIEEYVRSGRIMQPAEVSRRESIFLKPRYRSRSRFSSISKAAKSPDELQTLLKIFGKEKFIVSVPQKLARASSPCRVVLRKDAKSTDVLRALLTVGYLLEDVRSGKRSTWLKAFNGGDTSPESCLRSAQRAANRNFNGFTSDLRKAGWNVDHLLFGTVKRGAWWGASSVRSLAR